MQNLLKKLSPAIIFALVRWVATVLGSTAIGVWLSTHLTEEVVTSLYNNLSAIIGGVVAVIAIIQSVVSKSKAETKKDVEETKKDAEPTEQK